MRNDVPPTISNSLQELEDILEQGRGSFLNSRLIKVDADEIREIIQDIRDHLPKQIKQAEDINLNSAKIIAEANSRAKNIIEGAKLEAIQQVEEGEIVRLANERADEIIESAQNMARELRKSARTYLLERVDKSEQVLNMLLSEFNKNTLAIQTYINEQIADLVTVKQALMNDPMDDNIDEENYGGTGEYPQEEYDEEPEYDEQDYE